MFNGAAKVALLALLTSKDTRKLQVYLFTKHITCGRVSNRYKQSFFTVQTFQYLIIYKFKLLIFTSCVNQCEI